VTTPVIKEKHIICKREKASFAQDGKRAERKKSVNIKMLQRETKTEKQVKPLMIRHLASQVPKYQLKIIRHHHYKQLSAKLPLHFWLSCLCPGWTSLWVHELEQGAEDSLLNYLLPFASFMPIPPS
jgi:hypothetical protein